MFTQFYMHSLHVWEPTTAVHSRRGGGAGLCYVQMWWIQACYGGCWALLKRPNGNQYTTHQCKCYTNFSEGVVVAVSGGLVETQLQILICSEQLREMWLCVACVGVCSDVFFCFFLLHPPLFPILLIIIFVALNIMFVLPRAEKMPVFVTLAHTVITSFMSHS